MNLKSGVCLLRKAVFKLKYILYCKCCCPFVNNGMTGEGRRECDSAPIGDQYNE